MSGELTVSDVGKLYRRFPRAWHRLSEWPPAGAGPATKLLGPASRHVLRRGRRVGRDHRREQHGQEPLLKLITRHDPADRGRRSRSMAASPRCWNWASAFIPEFTGRAERAHGRAARCGIAGSRRSRRLMPEIEAFAEIGRYIDQPVRTYSSGHGRCGSRSAVATAVRPDILIVDEALSVGDAYFQHKCIARIREFPRRGHDAPVRLARPRQRSRRLCDRAMLLDARPARP